MHQRPPAAVARARAPEPPLLEVGAVLSALEAAGADGGVLLAPQACATRGSEAFRSHRPVRTERAALLQDGYAGMEVGGLKGSEGEWCRAWWKSNVWEKDAGGAHGRGEAARRERLGGSSGGELGFDGGGRGGGGDLRREWRSVRKNGRGNEGRGGYFGIAAEGRGSLASGSCLASAASPPPALRLRLAPLDGVETACTGAAARPGELRVDGRHCMPINNTSESRMRNGKRLSSIWRTTSTPLTHPGLDGVKRNASRADKLRLVEATPPRGIIYAQCWRQCWKRGTWPGSSHLTLRATK